MRTWLRRIFRASLFLSALLSFASAIAWSRSYRHPRGVTFHTRLELCEVVCRDGRYGFDNLPQRDADLRAATLRYDREMASLYGRVRENYEKSGRDLADDEHAAAREQMTEQLHELARLGEESLTRATSVRVQWNNTPPVVKDTPCWLVTAILGTPLALWLLVRGTRFVFRKRSKPGFCERCGYDLRATPEQCPECGLIASTASVV